MPVVVEGASHQSSDQLSWCRVLISFLCTPYMNLTTHSTHHALRRDVTLSSCLSVCQKLFSKSCRLISMTSLQCGRLGYCKFDFEVATTVVRRSLFDFSPVTRTKTIRKILWRQVLVSFSIQHYSSSSFVRLENLWRPSKNFGRQGLCQKGAACPEVELTFKTGTILATVTSYYK